MEERTCVGCGVVLAKKPGPGRWPKRCASCNKDLRQERGRNRETRSGEHRSLGVSRCAWCYEPFEARTDRRKFCGRSCAAKFNKTTGTSSRVEWRQCGHCWLWLTRSQDHLCSFAPFLVTIPDVVQPTVRCAWCDVMFVPINAAHKCCSYACRTAARNEGAASVLHHAVCAFCDVPFVGRWPSMVYCSSSCRRKRDRLREGRFAVPQRVRQSVYERDGWRCQLCGKRVGKKYPPLHDRAPSLDHVIPQSMGGDDSPENLQLAHRICNSVKNMSVFGNGEQLRLVG